MGVLKHKTITLPVVFVLSAGLGLTSVPAPAAASPPPPPPAADQSADQGGKHDQGGQGGKQAKRLEEALLAGKDVPKGFAEQDLPHIDEMFSSMVGGYRVNADPCAPPPKVPAGKPDDVPSATALFLHGKKNVALVEMLAATGPEVASDMVTDTETVLDDCPVTKSPGAVLAMESLNWNPKLGDESITVGMRFDVTGPDVEMVMHGKMAFVAYRNLSLTVGLIGVEEPSDRDFKNVVRAAVRKVVLRTPISTEH